jgi:mRNA interferase MazF
MLLTWSVHARSSRKYSTLSLAAKQGEVWLADLGLAAKTRPVVILSKDDPQAPRALNRGSPYEIELGNLRFLRELSVANVQGIGSIPAIRLQRKLGSLPTETLNKIKQALRSALDL